MNKSKTVWSIFRDYVNSKPIGTEITRQEILNQVEKELVEAGKTINHYQKGTVANFHLLLWIAHATWRQADIILKRPSELVTIR